MLDQETCEQIVSLACGSWLKVDTILVEVGQNGIKRVNTIKPGVFIVSETAHTYGIFQVQDDLSIVRVDGEDE